MCAQKMSANSFRNDVCDQFSELISSSKLIGGVPGSGPRTIFRPRMQTGKREKCRRRQFEKIWPDLQEQEQLHPQAGHCLSKNHSQASPP